MSTSRESQLLLRLYPLGTSHHFVVPCQGLEYSGEAVLLDRWEPDWGQPLDGEPFFRVVFLLNSGRVKQSDIRDSRISVCIPGQSSSRGYGSVRRELNTLAETRTRYYSGGGDTGGVIRHTLERQQQSLEEKLNEEDAARYAAGTIVSPTAFASPYNEIFSGPDLDQWVQRLGVHLLSWAYASSPLSWELFPRPLTPVDSPRIFEGMFSGKMVEGLKLFGPGLGFSSLESPGVFSPRHGGNVAADALHRGLSHGMGLTHDLASLFILAFLCDARPEVHIRMKTGHGLSLKDGRSLRGDLVTPELVPYLAWPTALHQKAFALQTPQPVSWNNSLGYTSLLCEGLTEVVEGEEYSSQMPKLTSSLERLSREVWNAEETLAELARVLKGADSSHFKEILERISRLCEGKGHADIYSLARRLFGGLGPLVSDLETLKNIISLGTAVKDVTRVSTYISGAMDHGGDAELTFQRKVVVEQFTLDGLIQSRSSMATLTSSFQEFQRMYVRRYLTHHKQYHQGSAILKGTIQGVVGKLRALETLDEMRQLGEPLGPEYGDGLDEASGQVVNCDYGLDEGTMMRVPVCPSCRLEPSQILPDAEVNRLVGEVDNALSEKSLRLSQLLAHRILSGRVDARLNSFLKVVQSSDLKSLVGVLDTDMATLIRSLLR